MKTLRIYSFWLWISLGANVLTGCSKSESGDTHAVPEYMRIRIVSEKIDRDLNEGEQSKLRSIVLGSSLETDEFYRISDMEFFCYKAKDNKVAEPMAVYLEERKIYLGHWIDARTACMTNRPVECLTISKDDALWLRDLSK